MIDATELKVNAWVLIDGQPLQLTLANWERLIVFKTFHRIEPIPISPAVLRAFGMHNSTGSSDWGFSYGDCETLLFHYSDNSQRWHYSMEGQREGAGVEYVHQLQGLIYYLSGVEAQLVVSASVAALANIAVHNGA